MWHPLHPLHPLPACRCEGVEELPNENVWKSGNLAKPLNPGKPSIRIAYIQEIQGDATSLHRFIGLQYSCLTCAVTSLRVVEEFAEPDSIHHLVVQQSAPTWLAGKLVRK